MPTDLETRSDIRIVLCQATVIYMGASRTPPSAAPNPKGGLWWCEACWGGGFLDHPPIGKHRDDCIARDTY